MTKDHRSGRRPSTLGKHEKGKTRKDRDARGEKADDDASDPKVR